MQIFDFNTRLLEMLTVPALIVLVLLAVLTMRSIVMRDRAMNFGKSGQADAQRVRYEQQWRNQLPSA